MGFLRPKMPTIVMPEPPPPPELPPLPELPALPALPELKLPEINIAAPEINIPEMPKIEMPSYNGPEYDDSEFDTDAPLMGIRDENRTDVTDLRINKPADQTPKTRRKKSGAINTAVNNASGLYINF